MANGVGKEYLWRLLDLVPALKMKVIEFR